MRRLLQLATLSIVALLFFAPAAWSQGQEVTVRMEDNFFDRPTLPWSQGLRLLGPEWQQSTYHDLLRRSVGLRNDRGGFWRNVSYVFEEPGKYDYFCIPHESMGMVRSVTVSDATAMARPIAIDRTATAAASPTATALADTGGPPVSSLLMALVATLALAVYGVIALTLLRRHSTS